MNSSDWVAEHVMGFERGGCWGLTGHGTSLSDGTHESWFSCDWCGQPIKPGPCPRYPFPKFTLVDLMRKLGEKGHHVMVRVDPERSQHKFTVVLNSYRVDDTDEPLEALCDYFYYTVGGASYKQHEGEADPALFANIRDAIKLLQKAVGQGL